MQDEELLEYAAKLLRHIKTDMPDLSADEILAVLALASLSAQGGRRICEAAFNVKP